MNRVPLLLLVVAGCVPKYTLRIEHDNPVSDKTVYGKGARSISSVVVLREEKPGKADGPDHYGFRRVQYIGLIEKALMAKGVRVVSGASTGRVVTPNQGEQRVESGQTLSDVERALVLAGNLHAEAVLEIVSVGFDDLGGRQFVPDKPDPADLAEVDPLIVFPGPSIRIGRRRFEFSGRLIDVKTGDILAHIDVARSLSDLLLSYEAECSLRYEQLLCDQPPLPLAETNAATSVMNSVVERVAQVVAREDSERQ